MAVAEVRRAKALALVLEKATIVDTAGNAVDLDALNADLAAAMAAGGLAGPRRLIEADDGRDRRRRRGATTPAERSAPEAGRAPAVSGRARGRGAAHALSEQPRRRGSPCRTPGLGSLQTRSPGRLARIRIAPTSGGHP